MAHAVTAVALGLWGCIFDHEKRLKTRSSQRPDFNMVPIFSALMVPPFLHPFPLFCRLWCHRFTLLVAPGLFLLTLGSVWDGSVPLFPPMSCIPHCNARGWQGEWEQAALTTGMSEPWTEAARTGRKASEPWSEEQVCLHLSLPRFQAVWAGTGIFSEFQFLDL